MSPTRRALLAAGVATLAVSLVLSMTPAFAARGGNSGSIKITDATSGQQADDNDNDPHVCSFWVGFYASEPFESGTWELLSWAPTGDGSVITSGTYDTSGDGLDATATLSPVAGHYRFDWLATGSVNAKHKTLWVDDTCGTDVTPPSDEETPPSEDETPPSQDETPPSEDETPPSEEEAPPSEEETPPSQDETPPSEEETPPSEEETPPSQDETPPSQDETPPSEDETPPSEEETPPSQDETPPSQDETPPSEEETPPSEEETPPSQDETPPSEEETPPSEAETPPSQDELPEQDVSPGSGGPPPSEQDAPEAQVAPSGASNLPDTALPLDLADAMAAIGVLLMIGASANFRRRPLRG
jgi:hypothetical protein